MKTRAYTACIGMYRHVSACISMYQHVSVCISMYQHVSACISILILCALLVEDKPSYRSKIEENLLKAQQKAEEDVKKRNEKKKENDKYVLRKAMDVSCMYF